MKTFWLVESLYFYDRKMARLIGSIRAEERPANEKISTPLADIYLSWFDSRWLAEQLVGAFGGSGSDSMPEPLRRPA